MALRTYRITAGEIAVVATSSVHDTTIRWAKVTGELSVDRDQPTQGAAATVRVDMRAFDAGDPMKNWKLKGELGADQFPEATFTLAHVTESPSGAPGFRGAAQGTLAWRGKSVPLAFVGTATFDDRGLHAQASFDLDMNLVGITPPKILMLRVNPTVRVSVSLTAA